MPKFSMAIDGQKLIGDVQTDDVEDRAITMAKLVSPKVVYIGLYDYAEYDRSVYDFEK